MTIEPWHLVLAALAGAAGWHGLLRGVFGYVSKGEHAIMLELTQLRAQVPGYPPIPPVVVNPGLGVNAPATNAIP